jgi:ornithine cyclodeaminase/alanine dehydrogenase
MANPVFVSDQVAREVLDWKEMIDALRDAHAAELHPHAAPPRTMARGVDGEWMRSLAAVPAGQIMGTKFFALSRQRNVRYCIALFDKDDASLVALVDANTVTARRTAATTAVALDKLAPRRRLRVGLYGSGAEASEHAHAVAAVREIASLAVFSPTRENREAFAERFSKSLGVPCRAVDTPEAATAEAELVVCATAPRPQSPNVKGAWLRPDQTVASIGSTLPEQWELDPEAIAKAATIVCDSAEEVTHGTADFIAARKEGVKFDDKVFDLADLLHGKLDARLAKGGMAMFKSAGTGLQDVVVATLAWRRAVERGLAVTLPMELSRKGGNRRAPGAAPQR